MYDYLIVGAGFAGSVLAERLAQTGRRVVLRDKRSHIAGNAYDHFDDAGVLVHKYGPHIFHTSCRRISSISRGSPSGGLTSTACAPASRARSFHFRSTWTRSISSTGSN